MNFLKAFVKFVPHPRCVDDRRTKRNDCSSHRIHMCGNCCNDRCKEKVAGMLRCCHELCKEHLSGFIHSHDSLRYG